MRALLALMPRKQKISLNISLSLPRVLGGSHANEDERIYQYITTLRCWLKELHPHGKILRNYCKEGLEKANHHHGGYQDLSLSYKSTQSAKTITEPDLEGAAAPHLRDSCRGWPALLTRLYKARLTPQPEVCTCGGPAR
eukprot:SAG11_NODE_2653_length_3124_cov_2.301818_6_plen_139_part_00